MKFKLLTQHHKPAVSDIFVKTFPEIPVEDLNISWNSRSKEDSYGIWLGHDNQDKMIGFVVASFHTSSASSMYIDFFAIDEAYRGNGLGTQLLQDFLGSFLAKTGSIHLYPRNPTVAKWYEKNGFRESTKGYYVCHTYETRSKV